MKDIVFTTQFKKDLKRYATDCDKMTRLNNVFVMLQNEVPLPRAMRPHKLKGHYHGCMECHVGPDFLLIWIDEQLNTIKLLRLGSHSELF